MTEMFSDRLAEAILAKKSHVVVGVDPDVTLIPEELRSSAPDGNAAESVCGVYRGFLFELLGGLVDDVVAVKIQSAFFEALGWRGVRLFEETIAEARRLGYLVIADVKRGDIGNTAEAYAKAHLGGETTEGADAVTVNPYFGTDGMEPFLKRARTEGKGLFVLVKTSNPSSAELQDVVTAAGSPVYEVVGDMVARWGGKCVGRSGWSSVGAVVGGTHPDQAARLRRRLPQVPFLIPGYGAQGATAADLAGLFGPDAVGAVVNSARAILYAYRQSPRPWLEAAQAEARTMKKALWEVATRR